MIFLNENMDSLLLPEQIREMFLYKQNREKYEKPALTLKM